MDEQEKIVNEYLKNKGYKKIVFEPDGNVTPDFLVDDEIAIEVRRLNQHHTDGEASTGLEVGTIPLYQAIYGLLPEYKSKYNGKSYFVFFKYKRPIKEIKSIKKDIREILDDYLNNPCVTTVEIKLNDNFSVKIIPASKQYDTPYLIGGYSDRDSGGWVLSEIEHNILICSEEKMYKVDKVRDNYSIWWLALVDHIGGYLNDMEKSQLDDELVKGHNWDKVLIINPNNVDQTYEI